MNVTTTSPRGTRPTPSQRVSGQPPPAPAVCTSQRTNAAWHVNGTQQPPSCRPAGGLAGFEPPGHGSVSDAQPRACVIRCPNKLPIPDTHHEGASSISRPGGTAGWLWNFRLDDVGRWHDSELLSLGGQLDHNDLGLQLEEFTSRFQCKKTDSEAAGHHKTTGPPNALARRTRLRPRATESSPRAGSRQPRLTDCSTAAASPPRPSAGETTSRAGRGYPTARTPGSGRRLITRAGAVNLTRGQHDFGTSRLVDSEWTGSPPNGEPRTRAPAAPTPDSDSDGTYHHGAALTLDPIQ